METSQRGVILQVPAATVAETGMLLMSQFTPGRFSGLSMLRVPLKP